MTKRVLMACLAALAFSAEAAPITFFNVQFDVAAVAITDGAPGFDAQSSPPAGTPVSASADSVGVTDIATAGAIGGPGLLTTSADVSASGGVANAVSTSHFSGSFLSGGPVTLNIDFTSLAFSNGSGAATTSLFVLLMSDGVTLFQDFITGPWEFEYFSAAPGAVGVLDLTLTSEATAGFPAQGVGGASTFGLVTLTTDLPLPGTVLLVLLALGAAVRISAQRGFSVR